MTTRITEVAMAWARLVVAEDRARDQQAGVLASLLDDRSALEDLVGRALSSEDPRERMAGASLVGHVSLTGEHLRQVSSDPVPGVRLALLRALSERSDVMPQAILERGFADPDQRVRALACRVAAKRADMIEALIGCLDDPTAPVVEAATEALLERDPAQVLDRLLSGEPGRVKVELVRRFAEISPGVVLDAASGLAPEVRSKLLSMVVTAQMRAELARRLTLRGPEQRLEALTTISEVGSDGVQGAVADALRDPEPQVRIAAAHVVAAHRLTSALDDLRQTFAADPDLQVASAAERALRMLLTEEAGSDTQDSTLRPIVPKEDI